METLGESLLSVLHSPPLPSLFALADAQEEMRGAQCTDGLGASSRKHTSVRIEIGSTIPYVNAVKPSLRTLGRFLRQIVLAVVAALVIWSVVIMLFEEKFIFFPSAYPSGLYDEARTLSYLEDCFFTAEDGVRLHAWFARAESPRATLVMAHGNAGNVSHRLPIIRALRERGFNVLMFDYRGYGRSEGTPGEEGVYRDGRAAYDYAAAQSDVDSATIVLWGTSLGGAVAVDVAVHRQAAALILESTFSSAHDVARVAYPFLPTQFILRTKLNSDEKIGIASIPILFIHGNRDSIIPISLGRKLFAAANEPKQFYVVEGADHNDIFWVGGTAYLDRIQQFVDSFLPHPTSSGGSAATNR
jgi:fermentation-respiration switch protein FrsA (DUF1100 family)